MMLYDEPALLDFVLGDATGVTMPAHAEALREAGADFLTRAFQAFGSLAADNRVVAITHWEPFPGGNSGAKLMLSVDYARPEAGLHADLFVKFSRDFADAFRDRRRRELEAEVRLAALSRLPAFPVEVPVPYFADFNDESGAGILITQRIAFGQGGVEPLRHKCMDHELDDPLDYYRATFRALACLAAAQMSGRLSPEVDQLFPFDRVVAEADPPISWTEPQLRDCIARFAAFAEACPGLVPADLATPQFIGRLETEAVRLLQHQGEIRRFLYADPRFVALCHWNTNIDNAWFWRDASGTLQCGLLDWGMVRQMNLAYALWGGLCSAPREVWATHLDALLALYADTLQAEGGPRLEIAELKLHLDMSVAILGLSLMIDAPALVLSRLPDAVRAEGPLDPLMFKDEVARNFLHVFTGFLTLWRIHDFGASLDTVLARAGGRTPG